MTDENKRYDVYQALNPSRDPSDKSGDPIFLIVPAGTKIEDLTLNGDPITDHYGPEPIRKNIRFTPPPVGRDAKFKKTGTVDANDINALIEEHRYALTYNHPGLVLDIPKALPPEVEAISAVEQIPPVDTTAVTQPAESIAVIPPTGITTDAPRRPVGLFHLTTAKGAEEREIESEEREIDVPSFVRRGTRRNSPSQPAEPTVTPKKAQGPIRKWCEAAGEKLAAALSNIDPQMLGYDPINPGSPEAIDLAGRASAILRQQNKGTVSQNTNKWGNKTGRRRPVDDDRGDNGKGGGRGA